MRKNMLVGLFALLAFSVGSTAFDIENDINYTSISNANDSAIITSETYAEGTRLKMIALYDTLNLAVLKLNREAYLLAVKGYQKLQSSGKLKNSHLLTIVDFSQPSTSKRLYIIDLNKRKLITHSLVSHGRNTGQLMAASFSNQPESFKSSLGFYITSETYNGKHGLSLRLDGMEKNINDNARNRAIVMHGADYADERFCKATGYLGRSYGCPAIPNQVSKTIINTIRDGSCLFIYFPDKDYLKNSVLAV